MSYDEVEIEDMDWSDTLNAFTYPCPCGDLFLITLQELATGEEIARCPSCSLYITVIYNPDDFNTDVLAGDEQRDASQQPPPQQVVV